VADVPSGFSLTSPQERKKVAALRRTDLSKQLHKEKIQKMGKRKSLELTTM
jgi:hypothetical protein